MVYIKIKKQKKKKKKKLFFLLLNENSFISQIAILYWVSNSIKKWLVNFIFKSIFYIFITPYFITFIYKTQNELISDAGGSEGKFLWAEQYRQ